MHDSTSTNLLNLPPKQPYRINNCKFQNSMISFLSELHNTKAYTDVVLHAEGKLLQAHRVVLAAGSSYFNNLFKSLQPPPRTTSDPQYQQNLVIALPNVRFHDLERVIKFIYFGYLDIVNSELEGFVDLAKNLGVVGMSDDDDEEEEHNIPDEYEEEEPPVQTTPHQHHSRSLEHSNVSTPTTSTQQHHVLHPYDVYDEEDSQEEPSSPKPPILTPSSPITQTIPPEYLQVAYTDEDDELLDGDQEMMDDEDEENSEHAGFVEGMIHPGGTPGNSSRFYSTDKPFVCVKCGKTYNSNKSLWRHKKFTCDEKIEFKCDLCGKVFSRSDNLRRHITVAH